MSLFINPHVAAHPSFLKCNTKDEFLKNILANIYDSFAILHVFKSLFFLFVCHLQHYCFLSTWRCVSWKKENWHEGEWIMTEVLNKLTLLKGRTEWRVKSCYSLCPSVGYKEVRLFSILHSQEVKQIHLLAYVFLTATLKYFTHPSQETKEQKCEIEA